MEYFFTTPLFTNTSPEELDEEDELDDELEELDELDVPICDLPSQPIKCSAAINVVIGKINVFMVSL